MILSEGVFDIVVFCVRVPAYVELMNLDGHLHQNLSVKALVYLTEASLAQQPQQLILFYLGPAVCLCLYATVPRALLFVN